MLLAILLSSLATVGADFASIHMHNWLNQSVAPCEDFYHHVCANNMGTNDTVRKKSENFYKDMAAKLQSRSLNNPIMNDIAEARSDLNCTFDGDVYTQMLNERCSSEFDCFFEEFKYFFNLYNATNKNVDDSLKFYLTHGNKTAGRNIAQARRATSKMVELLYKNSEFNRTKSFNESVGYYERLNDRMFVMETLNSSFFDSVGIEKINGYARQMKELILKQFQATSWMAPVNQFGFTIIGQYRTVLDELIILTDFDNLDRNLTFMRTINHEISTRYLENSKRGTGCTWFDVTHAFNTTSSQMEKKYTGHDEKSNMDEVNYYRLYYTFQFNAFNFYEHSIIAMLAPSFYPLLENSTETTHIANAYILGHEFYHSFIREALQNRSEEYKSEVDCMSQHYNQTCQLFGENSKCHSGAETFNEDGPDVEGTRTAIQILNKEYPGDKLMEFEYPDLQVTRQQAFFYSIAMLWCADIANLEYDEHSPDYIRVNALVSQLPEFSQAFGCKADDVLRLEEEDICYLFGEKAVLKKKDNSTLVGLQKKKRTEATTAKSGAIGLLDDGAELLMQN